MDTPLIKVEVEAEGYQVEYRPQASGEMRFLLGPVPGQVNVGTVAIDGQAPRMVGMAEDWVVVTMQAGKPVRIIVR
jgi:hypothetical protein